MFAAKTHLVLLGFIALQTAYGYRFIRSPGKMEVDIPHHGRGSGEYQEDMNKEVEYWQGQGEDKEKEGHSQMDEDREKNEEIYNNEKDHHQSNQEAYNNEMNQTYQSDRDKLESHEHDNQEHYQDHNTNINMTVPDVTKTETADRYEDIGNGYKEEREDEMNNYEPGQNNPSITYTRD